ncbi:hypothetical protein CANCADRAFT_11308, partial [Tortispora caseinolytica NRRL Y-17796]
EEMFGHPYDPYPIQVDLMNAIYDTIASGKKVGIFESPTGTGKTLSLLCATLAWERQPPHPDDPNASDAPSWVQSATDITQQLRQEKWSKFFQQLQKPEIKHQARQKPRKRYRPSAVSLDSFLPDEDTTNISETASFLLREYSRTQSNAIENTDPQIIFTSRTHSQLSQLASQLRLVSPLPYADDSALPVRYIPLASRSRMCIYEPVMSSPAASINDRCRDARKGKGIKTCPYVAKPTDPLSQARASDLSDALLTGIHDIEDIVSMGESLSTCPYYAVKHDIAMAEIISLPYNLLLDDTARRSISLPLRNSIIIIDEAHNLLETLSSILSKSVSLSLVDQALHCLQVYLDKFQNRLKPHNRVHVLHIQMLLRNLQQFLMQIKTTPAKFPPGSILDSSKIFSDSAAESINIYTLADFVSKSKLAFKINSYMDYKLAEKTSSEQKKSFQVPLLSGIISFLITLNFPSQDGQLVVETNSSNPSLLYLQLDVSHVFETIVEQAKCVILAGGTMEPMDDFVTYLLPKMDPSLINRFSCGHVIPENNVHAYTITQVSENPITVTFANRSNKSTANDIGVAIHKLCSVIPFGAVVFFPSYTYLKELLSNWSDSGTLQDIEVQKKVMYEPTNSALVEQTLLEFQDAANSKGAVLFCVTGGKMSEGINFTDNLARGVIMVGVPFPNIKSVETIARSQFIKDTAISNGLSESEAKAKSAAYIEGTCIRAVNQAMGRAIRHANDYAALFFIDERYSKIKIQTKLSKWVRDSIQKATHIENVMEEAKVFY